MITEEQLNQIIKRLQDYGIKDTQFPEASPLSGEESVAIIQENLNKRTTLQNIVNYIKNNLDITIPDNPDNPVIREDEDVIEAKWAFFQDGYAQLWGTYMEKWTTLNFTLFSSIGLPEYTTFENFMGTLEDSYFGVMDTLHNNSSISNHIADVVENQMEDKHIHGSYLDFEVLLAPCYTIDYGIPLNSKNCVRVPFTQRRSDITLSDYSDNFMTVSDAYWVITHECKGVLWEKFFAYFEAIDSYMNGNTLDEDDPTYNSRNTKSSVDIHSYFSNIAQDKIRHKGSKSAVGNSITIDSEYFEALDEVLNNDLNSIGRELGVSGFNRMYFEDYTDELYWLQPYIVQDALYNTKVSSVKNPDAYDIRDQFNYISDVTELGASNLKEFVETVDFCSTSKYREIIRQLNNMFIWITDDQNNPITENVTVSFYKRNGKYYLVWYGPFVGALKINRIGNIIDQNHSV